MGLAPRFVTYLLSFLTLGIFWGAQQTQFNQLARADRHYAWLNLAFLAVVAIMPFSTSLLAEFITYRLALAFYWLNILALGVAWYAMWIYATRAGLVKEGTGPDVSRALRQRFIVAQALYAFGALLGLVSTYWGHRVHRAGPAQLRGDAAFPAPVPDLTASLARSPRRQSAWTRPSGPCAGLRG